MSNVHSLIRDELAMANITLMEVIHEVCCELKHSPAPFGGIAFLGLGDFGHVAPVVKG